MNNLGNQSIVVVLFMWSLFARSPAETKIQKLQKH